MFRLRSTPGTTWPWIPNPYAGQVYLAYQGLLRSQFFPREELEAGQLSQLNTLLAHCIKHVPAYRRLLEVDKLALPFRSLDELRQLPITTRALHQEHSGLFLADRLPEGMEMLRTAAHTSGTNGTPVRVLKTNHDQAWWEAHSMRDLDWAGFQPSWRMAGIRLISASREVLEKESQGIEASGSPLYESGPAFGLDSRFDGHHQLEWLKRTAPNFLVTLPSNLEVLCDLTDGTLKLGVIQCLGEPLSDELKQRAQTLFGAKVVNQYSTAETGYVASTCPTGKSLHVYSENVIAEVLREDDTPCGPGETGRLILTALHRYGQPFIRYAINDEVTIAEEPCPCGRGLPTWTRVDGRIHEMMILPDGSKKHSTGITLGIRQIGGVKQFQIVQKTTQRFEIRVVPSKEWSLEKKGAIQARVLEEFGHPVEVDVVELPELDRPSGKLRVVVIEAGKS